MQPKYNKELTSLAKNLRRNMTPQERDLWYQYLRHHPLKFTRQKVLGKYIADFYCASAKLVIELDGSQHYDEKGMEADRERTQFLMQYGIRVLRIPNNAVSQNLRGVCDYIDAVLQGTVPFPEVP